MRNHTSSLSTLALGAVLSTGLLMGGCSKKDKDTVTAAQTMAKVKSRKVSEAEATKALKLMGLDASTATELAWSDRSGSAGNYVFTNLTDKNETEKDGVLSEMVLKGVHMNGEDPAFDHIAFNGFKLQDDDALVTFKTLSLTNPTPALASALALSLSGDENAFDDFQGEIGFDAISFQGLNVKSDDNNVSLDGLSLAKTKTGKGNFILDNFDVDAMDDGKAVKVSLGSINVAGVNIEKYKGLFNEAVKSGHNGEEMSEAVLAKVMGAMNPYDLDFNDFSLKDFHANVAGLVINLDTMSGHAEKKGGKVHMNQSMSPLTITPPTAEIAGELLPFVQAMETLGYESLEFTMKQSSVLDEKTDSMIVKDSYIAMKDGFKLGFDYDMVGYKAYMQAALAQSAQPSSNPMDSLKIMNSLKFNSLRMDLRDDSIVNRAFKLAAAQQGGTPDALKSQAKMGLAFLPMMAQDEAQQKIAGELSTALGAWLDNGGTLVFDMKPEAPLVIGDIIQGATSGQFDAATLGLTITQE